MTEQELQELSRKAAGFLPSLVADGPLFGRSAWLHGYHWLDGIDAVTADKMDIYCAKIWLHESTEACAEIMIRALPSDLSMWKLDGKQYIAHLADCRIIGRSSNESNPMLAFRVAVLRALCALKG